jgi:hypothetical protein
MRVLVENVHACNLCAGAGFNQVGRSGSEINYCAGFGLMSQTNLVFGPRHKVRNETHALRGDGVQHGCAFGLEQKTLPHISIHLPRALRGHPQRT